MKPSQLKFGSAILLALLIVIAASGCQDNADKAELDKYRNMDKVCNQNKEIFSEVISAIESNNFDKLNQLMSEDFVLKAPGLTQPMKKEEIFPHIKTFYASFPDWTHRLEDMVAEGDKVAVRGGGIGTQKALYNGIEPTDRRITQESMSIMTIVEGKVMEWWVIEDNLGLMQQLGMELKIKENTK